MNLLFCHDRLYSRSRDGTVLSYGGFPYSLWEHRFLPHFETMTVIGIKKKVTEKETGILDISSGKNVRHVLLPDIRSPFRQLLQHFRIRRKIAAEVDKADALIIRGPVDFGVIAAAIARKRGKPYAVEMTGCAYDISYFNGTFLGKILAPLKLRQSQNMVRHANAVIYVTERFLQSRYPTDGAASCASNVEIAAAPEYVLTGRMTRIAVHKPTLNIGLIGNFMGGFRGLDIALNALGIVKAQMSETHQGFHLKLLGQGGNVSQWEELIAHNALEGKVEFCGAVPAGQSVLEWLDDIDVYLQPSFHEGLPRTMIEAMSRGCAVLASDAGGTGELLENHYIHPRGDVGVLASHILDHLQKPDYSKQAQRNFQKAKNYSSEFLVPRRHQFWADFAKMAKEKSGKTVS